tara:strand:- start:2870 stop:3187 length:318 start_codon:yes stop_codon:yes gene_type:complete
LSDAQALRFPVTGAVTFDNLMEIRRAGEATIAEAEDGVVFDLSGLENGNSAAVALLMAWFRAADRHDRAVAFAGAPAELVSIIELSGLTEVLPLEGAAGHPEQNT